MPTFGRDLLAVASTPLMNLSEELDELFGAIASTGNKDIYVEHINLSSYILERLRREMKNIDKNILKTFYQSQDRSYREKLNEIVMRLVRKYNLNLRLDSTIYHKELNKN